MHNVQALRLKNESKGLAGMWDNKNVTFSEKDQVNTGRSPRLPSVTKSRKRDSDRLGIWLVNMTVIGLLCFLAPHTPANAQAQESPRQSQQHPASSIDTGKSADKQKIEAHLVKIGEHINRIENELKKYGGLESLIQKEENPPEEILKQLHSLNKEQAIIAKEVLNTLSQIHSTNYSRVNTMETSQASGFQGLQRIQDEAFDTFTKTTESVEKDFNKLNDFITNTLTASVVILLTGSAFLIGVFYSAASKQNKLLGSISSNQTRQIEDVGEMMHGSLKETRHHVDKMVNSFELTLRQVKENVADNVKMIERLKGRIDDVAPEVASLQGGLTSLQAMVRGPRTNPFTVGRPVNNNRGPFVRKELAEQILNGIHNNCFYIDAPRRAGKTSFLNYLVKQMREERNQSFLFEPISIDMQAVDEENLHTVFANALVNAFSQILDRNGFSEDETIQKKLSSMWEISKDLEEISELEDVSGPIVDLIDDLNLSYDHVFFVYVVDEFSKFNDFHIPTREKFRTIFMDEPGQNPIRVIAAGGKLEIWEGTSPFNFMIEMKLNPFTEKQVHEFIETTSAGVFHWEEKALKQASTASGGLPYNVQKVCYAVAEQALANGIQIITEELVNTVLTQSGQNLSGELTCHIP